MAEAIRASGVSREDIFVSESQCRNYLLPGIRAYALTATKCMSSTHGYESTLRGVNKSLKKMKFGGQS